PPILITVASGRMRKSGADSVARWSSSSVSDRSINSASSSAIPLAMRTPSVRDPGHASPSLRRPLTGTRRSGVSNATFSIVHSRGSTDGAQRQADDGGGGADRGNGGQLRGGPAGDGAGPRRGPAGGPGQGRRRPRSQPAQGLRAGGHHRQGRPDGQLDEHRERGAHD